MCSARWGADKNRRKMNQRYNGRPRAATGSVASSGRTAPVTRSLLLAVRRFLRNSVRPTGRDGTRTLAGRRERMVPRGELSSVRRMPTTLPLPRVIPLAVI